MFLPKVCPVGDLVGESTSLKLARWLIDGVYIDLCYCASYKRSIYHIRKHQRERQLDQDKEMEMTGKL